MAAVSKPDNHNNNNNKADAQQAGYGNGGIESMAQFDKLYDKISNSLKNLEYTRDMIKKLAENEKNSAKTIATILNQKNKTLRFSVVDQSIQNYWKKQESNRRHFANALQTKIIQQLDNYINTARDKKKKLQKENKKIQNTFIECKKEATKQKQISLKEWQKLEEQIQKNEALKKQNKKTKDLKSLQDKCSKAFAKYESYIGKLNELEQINHEQACDIGQLLHESQRYASERLSMHYNMTVSTKKYLEEFIISNKSIVQSKAPPLNDILWRWLTYPKNHQTHNLPCTSKEVFMKKSIGQSFKRRVEPDFQESKYLKKPKQSKPSSKSSKPSKPSKQQILQQSQQSQQPQQPQQPQKPKQKREKKNKKSKKTKTEKQPQPQPQPQVDDQWDVDFGADNNNNNNNDNDIFGTVQDVKQPAIEQKQEPKQIDLVQQHKQEMNGFDPEFGAGFDDDFGGFDDNNDLKIANDNNADTMTNGGGFGGGFGGDWNTNFDEDTFAMNNDNNQTKQDNEADVDALFDTTDTNDIFGDNGGGGTAGGPDDDQDNHDLFNNDFGGDDLFGNDENKQNDQQIQDNNDGGDGDDGGDGSGGLFDDEFDDDQAIEFPEFDMNSTQTTIPKKRKSKLAKKTTETIQPTVINAFPQSSPQPNEITTIPEPVISFDAPQPTNNDDDADANDNNNDSNQSEEIDTDNPFGNDPFGGDDDDEDGHNNHNNDDDDDDDDEIDGDNPFAMFEEPDNDDNDDKNGAVQNGHAETDEFDPFQ